MKKSFKLLFIIFFFQYFVCSCNRIENKGKEIAEDAKHSIKEKLNDLVDKVAPHFDAYTPDTKYNKERFKEFLQVELTSDIKNIYCFDDAIGIDADYQFAFNCNLQTAERIKEKHHMVEDTENAEMAMGLQNDFVWWDKKKIEKLKLYSCKGEHEYYQFFWYDEKEQKAYYFDFDM
jgi:hypothetical protein